VIVGLKQLPSTFHSPQHPLLVHARALPQVASLHGEMGKQTRQSVLEEFGRGDHRVLLVSDVAARGLDVPGG